MSLNRISRVIGVVVCFAALAVPARPVGADIFEWEFIDPADPSQGKRESTTLVPSGAGVDALPKVRLDGLDLTSAYLAGSNLTDVSLGATTLTDAELTDAIVAGVDFGELSSITEQQLVSTASYKTGQLPGLRFFRGNFDGWDLSGQNLTNSVLVWSSMVGTDFRGADLTEVFFDSTNMSGANLTDAIITRASFSIGALNFSQLISTASYKQGDLRGINLTLSNRAGWDFTGQDMTKAELWETELGGANFTNANLTDVKFFLSEVAFANFDGTTVSGADFSHVKGFSEQDLASTASYKSGNLSRIRLVSLDLTGWNLVGQDLSGADFTGSTIANIDLSDAVVVGANFRGATGKGFTEQQLASTASYKTGDLSGIRLIRDDLTGWDFSGKNLTGASFRDAELAGTDMTDAVIVGLNLEGTTDAGFTWDQLASTASYQAGVLVGVDLDFNDLTGWDLSGLDLSGTSMTASTVAGVDLTGSVVKGADFSYTTSRGFTEQQLASTASYIQGDLAGIGLEHNDLSGWDLSGQDLSNANLIDTTLAGTDLSDANIKGARFLRATIGGLTEAQFISTASYKAGDLSGTDLRQNDLTGWDFSGQNLTGANFNSSILDGADFTGADLSDSLLGISHMFADFTGANLSRSILGDDNYSGSNFTNANMEEARLNGANLTGADLTNAYLAGVNWNQGTLLTNAILSGADARGAFGLFESQFDSAHSTRNFIRPDGTIRDGLMLTSGESMWIRDDDGDDILLLTDITIQNSFNVDPDGTLRIIFEDLDWGSLIRFDPSVGTALLGGTLELGLDLDSGLIVEDLLGSTFRLFDWTGVTLNGAFDVIAVDAAFTGAGLGFDTSNLYTTGEVTVIPEPVAGALLGAGALCLLRRRR